MISETRFSAFLDRIYEAAARPEPWRKVLNEMAFVTESAWVQMTRHGLQGATLHASSKGLDDVLRAYFYEGWNRNNPGEINGRLRASPPTRSSRIATCSRRRNSTAMR